MASRITFLLCALALFICFICVVHGQISIKKFSKKEIREATKAANAEMRRRKKLMNEMMGSNTMLKISSAGFKNSVFRRPTPQASKIADDAERTINLGIALNVNASLFRQKLDEKTGIRQKDRGRRQVGILDNTEFADCKENVVPSCNFNSKYRTIDGSCNNRRNPKWGQTLTAFVRLLDPDYADAINSPRIGVNNETLPSARLASTAITETKSKPSQKFTQMVMQWGQFLDHDITFTPAFTPDSNSGPYMDAIKCCSRLGKVEPNCFPIDVSTDSFYQQFGTDCIEFTRSLAANRRDCKLGAREQLNEITAYIDASNVYGSDEQTAKELRTKNGHGATLRTGNPLPLSKVVEDNGCTSNENNPVKCFHAGDKRASEQPNLVVMHAIWVKQHNFIVEKLKDVRSKWDDEKLYQEARRIVGAQMQHITYNEFLPIVLGKQYVTNNNLLPRKNGYSDTYDAFADASIANEFATAAYRFGHSLIQGTIKTFDSKFKEVGTMQLSKSSFKPQIFNNADMFRRLLRGLFKQEMQKFDRCFTSQVRNKLFAGNQKFGLDLVALNTQRGRDHGLPSYAEYREFCGLGKVTSFNSFSSDIKKPQRDALKKIYKDPRNVDLFIGGIVEEPKNGALVGNTFRCLIGEQFRRLKTGDRFFYETKESTTRFTKDQLDELRKTSLARVICDNSEISEIQPLVFREAGGNNKITSCSDEDKIPQMDFGKW